MSRITRLSRLDFSATELNTVRNNFLNLVHNHKIGSGKLGSAGVTSDIINLARFGTIPVLICRERRKKLNNSRMHSLNSRRKSTLSAFIIKAIWSFLFQQNGSVHKKPV